MKLKIKKLHENAVVPSYAHDSDAGLDLTSVSVSRDASSEFIEYDTGLSLEIPEGYVGLLFPRSSVSKTTLTLTNSVGVIDSGYRGSVKVRFKHIGSGYIKPYVVGDRVAQLIIIPYPKVEIEEVTDLNDSDRGLGGFGSTGE
jgi:dUTP pyrophosphatase